MWNLPRPGIEPVSLALAGRFLTTGPQGRSISDSNAAKDKHNETLGKYLVAKVLLQEFAAASGDLPPSLSHGTLYINSRDFIFLKEWRYCS